MTELKHKLLGKYANYCTKCKRLAKMQITGLLCNQAKIQTIELKTQITMQKCKLLSLNLNLKKIKAFVFYQADINNS